MRKQFKVGDTVTVATSWGRGILVEAKIVNYERNGRKGRDVIDYSVTKAAPGYPIGAQHWAYTDQIMKVNGNVIHND